jgi:hypothetical protein
MEEPPVALPGALLPARLPSISQRKEDTVDMIWRHTRL